MKLLHPTPSNVVGTEINVSHFSYRGRTFITDASTLSHLGVSPFGQLYKDACDTGFIIANPKTGQSVPFYQSGTDRTGDGEDIAGFRFKVCPESARKFPQVANLEVLIVNS